MRSEIKLCHRMAMDFDELAEMLRDHEEFHHEILPYLFVGDVMRWYVTKWRTGDPVANRFASWLEGEFVRGDHGTQNVIGVSFLEHLPSPSRKNPSDIAETFGPFLRNALESLRQTRSE